MWKMDCCPVPTCEHYCEKTNHVWDSLYNLGVIQEIGQILYFSFRSWSYSSTILVLDTQGKVITQIQVFNDYDHLSWCQRGEYFFLCSFYTWGLINCGNLQQNHKKNLLTHKHRGSFFLQTIPFYLQFQETRLRKKQTTIAYYSSLTCIQMGHCVSHSIPYSNELQTQGRLMVISNQALFWLCTCFPCKFEQRWQQLQTQIKHYKVRMRCLCQGLVKQVSYGAGPTARLDEPFTVLANFRHILRLIDYKV